jgi:hypothetical protein
MVIIIIAMMNKLIGTAMHIIRINYYFYFSFSFYYSYSYSSFSYYYSSYERFNSTNVADSLFPNS